MKTSFLKRFTASLLAVMMLIGVMPATVFAQEIAEEIPLPFERTNASNSEQTTELCRETIYLSSRLSYYEAIPLRIVFDADYEGDKSWTITSLNNNAYVDTASGYGNATVSFYQKYFADKKSRHDGHFQIIRGDGKCSEVIIVDGYSYDDDPYLCDDSVTSAGSTFSADSVTIGKYVEFDTNCSWTATVSENWCTLSKYSGSDAGSIDVYLSANTTGQSRTCTITVSANGCEDIHYYITQSGNYDDPYISLESNICVGGYSTGNRSIPVYSNCDWDVEVITNKEYVEAKRYGDSVHLDWARWRNYNNVTSIIKVFAENCEPQYLHFVRLRGTYSFGDEYMIHPEPVTLFAGERFSSPSADYGEFVSWTAMVDADWVTLSQYEGNTWDVPLPIYATFTGNDTGEWREAVITVNAYYEKGTHTQTVAISQRPYVTFDFAESSYTVGCEASTIKEALVPVPEENVFQQVSMPDWITLEPSKSDDFYADICVEENKGQARTGYIVFSHTHVAGYTVADRVIEIKQAGAITVVTAPEARDESGCPILQGKLTLTGSYQYSDFSVGFQFYNFKTNSWGDANYYAAGSDQPFALVVAGGDDGQYAYRAAAKNNTTGEEYFGERREFVIGDIVEVAAPIPTQSNMTVNRGETVTISWSASEGAERYGVWFYDTNPGTYVDAGSSLSVTHVFEHNNPKDSPFAVQIYAFAGTGENQKQSEPGVVLVTVGCAEGEHDFTSGTVYDRTLYKEIPGDNEYHLAYADVYKQTCIECGMGGFEETVDREEALQEKDKHYYANGVCQVEGCGHTCAHQYEDKLENDEKVPVTNSGVWDSKGENGHVCSSIKYVTQCKYCLLESTREEAYPYGDEVQPHLIHTEVLAYGYDKDDHWPVKVRETCGALGCNYNAVTEEEGKHEPHQMEDGSCTVCGNGVQTGTFKYPGYINQEVDSTATYYYSDSYFNADATGEANPHLATMSLCLELSAWTSYKNQGEKWDADDKVQNAYNLLSEIGFDKIKRNNGWETKPEMNSIGAIAAYKNIDDSTVIALAVRGGNYASEWGGNFVLGADGNHKGFETARNDVLEFLKGYISDHNSEFKSTVKIWVVGFSRGGATANMVAGALIDNIEDVGIRFKPENVFAYTFEAPMGYVGNNSGYPSIKNYVLSYDLVPLVAPSDWGFGRYNGPDDILLLEGSLGTERYENLVFEFEKQYEKVKAGVPYHEKNQNPEYRIKSFADRFYITGLSSEWFLSDANKSGNWSEVVPGVIMGIAQCVTPTDEMLAYTVDMLFDHFPGLREGYNKDIEKELTEWVSFLTDYEEPDIDWGKVLNDAFFTERKIGKFSVGETGIESIVSYLLSPLSMLNPEAKITRAATDATLMICDEISKQTGKVVSKQLETALNKLLRAVIEAFFDSPGELISVVYYIATTGFQCHWPEISLAWLMSKDSYYTDSATEGSLVKYWSPETWRTIIICCPVDVIVYDENGNEFASIRGETVTNTSDVHGVAITETGSKQVILPADAGYTIKIIATGNGEMDYTVYEYNVRDRKYNLVKSYQDLPLTTGDNYHGAVPAFPEDDYYDAESDGSTVEYTLRGPNGKELEPDNVLRGTDVYYANVSLSTNNNKGIVTGGGSFVAHNYAQIEAMCMPTVEFLGWYLNDQLVSNESIYRFEVTEDVELVAHFSEGDYHTLTVTGAEGGIVPEGSWEVPATIQIQLNAEAMDGYEFVGWEATAGTFDDPQRIDAIFTMSSSDVTITAVFRVKAIVVPPQVYYTLTVTSTEGGTVATDRYLVPANAEVPLSAMPNEGYEFIGWEATAGTFSDPHSMQTVFTMPASDVSVMAVFEFAGDITPPQTGDATPLELYWLLFSVSVCAMLIYLNKTNRKARKQC